MKTLLRGGLIGCGFFAQNHLHAWKQIEGAALVAVCDSDAEKATRAEEKFGILAGYTDAEKMLAEQNLDFVDVATGVHSHRALVELAAKYRVPVICQKPLALTIEDARAMVDACEAANIPFMVHENFRWQYPMRQVKAEAQNIGELTYGRIAFRTPYDVFANQPYLATDERFIISDLGIHLLDLARFFFGEMERVYCVTKRVNQRIAGEDSATIVLNTKSDVSVIVEASYSSQTERDLFPQTLIALEGTSGSVTLDADYRLTSTVCAESPYEIEKPNTAERTVIVQDATPPIYEWSSAPFDAVQDSVLAIQQHWIHCLQTGTMPETSGLDNLKTLELVEASYRSAETGTVVKL